MNSRLDFSKLRPQYTAHLEDVLVEVPKVEQQEIRQEVEKWLDETEERLRNAHNPWLKLALIPPISKINELVQCYYAYRRVTELIKNKSDYGPILERLSEVYLAHERRLFDLETPAGNNRRGELGQKQIAETKEQLVKDLEEATRELARELKLDPGEMISALKGGLSRLPDTQEQDLVTAVKLVRDWILPPAGDVSGATPVDHLDNPLNGKLAIANAIRAVYCFRRLAKAKDLPNEFLAATLYSMGISSSQRFKRFRKFVAKFIPDEQRAETSELLDSLQDFFSQYEQKAE